MYTSVSGMTAPAKAPARSRAATKCQVVSDRAERMLKALKPSAAVRMTAMRPKRSESGP